MHLLRMYISRLEVWHLHGPQQVDRSGRREREVVCGQGGGEALAAAQVDQVDARLAGAAPLEALEDAGALGHLLTQRLHVAQRVPRGIAQRLGRRARAEARHKRVGLVLRALEQKVQAGATLDDLLAHMATGAALTGRRRRRLCRRLELGREAGVPMRARVVCRRQPRMRSPPGHGASVQ
eukprot:scaffold43453_cov75-Phaeocystis_antarctica.AAC.3